ncbi:hypothetical protein J7M23_01030 [Candidatus Sumerlaeota bacterium]|nr:hypothetical protein [Candidatus Sumerlaeota bacterium]
MGAIKGILKEELKNSLQMKRDYERELAKLPKGTLVQKKVKGHTYYYLEFREGKKVKFVYKGKLSENEIKKYQEAKKYRAKYKKLLAQTNQQIRFLRRALRGKDTV